MVPPECPPWSMSRGPTTELSQSPRWCPPQSHQGAHRGAHHSPTTETSRSHHGATTVPNTEPSQSPQRSHHTAQHGAHCRATTEPPWSHHGATTEPTPPSTGNRSPASSGPRGSVPITWGVPGGVKGAMAAASPHGPTELPQGHLCLGRGRGGHRRCPPPREQSQGRGRCRPCPPLGTPPPLSCPMAQQLSLTPPAQSVATSAPPPSSSPPRGTVLPPPSPWQGLNWTPAAPPITQ